MSLKLVTSFGLTNTVTVFEKPEDAFHPHKNPLWQNDAITVNNFFQYLKTTYTKENLTAHPKLFLTSSYFEGAHAETLRNKVLEVVPEDKLWALAYLSLSADNSGRVSYSIWTGRNRSMDYRGAVFNYNDDYSTFRSLVTSDTFAGNLMEKVNKVVDSWTPLYTDANTINEVFQVEYNLRPMSNYFYTLLLMWAKKKYIRNESETRSVGIFSELLNATNGSTENINIEITGHDGYFEGVKYSMTVTDNFRAPIHKLLNYSANIYEILGGPLLDKGETEENTPLYGVELELSTNYTVHDLVEAGKSAFMACKSDGSVNGNKRYFYECVTRPMSLKMQKRQWAYFFSKLDYGEFDTTKNTNNGMHVHISRKAFLDKIHLHKFTWFFTTPAHRAFMLAMSERTESSFDQYSPTPSFSGTKGKSFANVLNAVAGVRGAVNLKKGPTVEVRLFRGIVSFASVLKNLEFVDAVLHFSADRSMSELSLRDFNTWLYSTPKNRYIVLKKWFDEMNIAQFFIYSDVKNVVFTEKNANKVLEMVKKAGIKITEDHLKVLNEDNPDTFIITKEGQLDLHPKFRNSIASMDRVLEFNLLRGWN